MPMPTPQEQVTTTFALTKIRPPQARAELIERTALTTRLSHALTAHQLVLISAPAGFGKTALLAQTWQRLPEDCARAWISLDEDDDLQRFLTCLTTALDPHDLPWRVAPDALPALQAQPHGVRSIADELLNALGAADATHGVVVLDDAHRLVDRHVFELLDWVLERLPAKWTIALSSRIDPPLALARLRVRGELIELRQTDLRFSLDEATQLVSRTGQEAAPAQLQALLDRTQGWAAGLRLSLDAHTHQRALDATPHSGVSATGFAKAQRHLFDFLASEVLDQMPAPLRLFLLRCSVLPELTAKRCAAVSGDPHAAQWLDEIDRRGLFVTLLDSDELTLRLHDLFRDFLEDRLQRDQAEELPTLLARAAEVETEPVRRVGLLLRAGRWEDAQQVLGRALPQLLLAGANAHIVRLIEQFPAAVREHSPVLAFARGRAALQQFQWDAMHHAMAHAAAGFEAAGQAPLAQQACLLDAVALLASGRIDEASARMAQVRAQPMDRDLQALNEQMAHWETGARGPAAAPARHLAQMVDLLAHGSGSIAASVSLWHRCTSQPPPFLFVGRPGMRAATQQLVAHARAAAGDAHSPLRAVVNCRDAWLALWQARLPEANALMREVQDDDRWLGQPRNLRVPIQMFLGVYHALRGEREPVHQAYGALLREIGDDHARSSSWRGFYLCGYGRACAALEEWDTARELMNELERTPTDFELPAVRLARGTLRALRAQHESRSDEVLTLLSPLLERSSDIDMFGWDAALRIVLAQAQLASRAVDAAACTLAPLLTLVQASDEPTGVLLAGPRALRSLARAAWGEQLAPENVALLHRLGDLAEGLRAAPSAPGAGVLATAVAPALSITSGVPRTLSERELAVLARISAGDSNKLIARAFDLSPHTVKRHVANILTKLDLASRGQAAAWYRTNVH
jgi:LuxR family maltose regulon positive regulatory protein